MKIQIPQPNIPILEKPLIAVRIDLKRKREHIVIGEFDDVNRYLRGWKKRTIIFEEIRPIGSFLLDIKPKAMELRDLMGHLYNNICKKPYINTKVIEDFYNEGNPPMKFLILKIWGEYLNALERFADKKDKESEKNKARDMYTAREEMTLPFRYILMDEILKWQGSDIINPLSDMPYEYYKYPVQKILVPDRRNIIEYLVSDNTLLPIIISYMQTIYEEKKYFSYCKVCGKLFLSTDFNKNVICSDKCRKAQQKKNKQKFDNATCKVDYEITYRNENMYWYNRIQKAKKRNLDEKALAELQEAYKEFQSVASIMKKQVKDGTLSFNDFDMWYLDMRCEIDMLMEKNGLGKYK